MAIKIYACDNCGFVFSRTGECTKCPDCGKITIRCATDDEKSEFEYRISHPEESDNEIKSYYFGKRAK